MISKRQINSNESSNHNDNGNNGNVNNNDNDNDNDNDNSDVLHKINLMHLNNGWNDNNEKIIISVGENAVSYKWMHERCASQQKFIYTFFSILLIILSTSLTAESIFPNNICNGDNTPWDIAKRLIVYLVNVLTVLQTFLNSQEVSEKHLTAAISFSTLYHDIQQQMCTFRRDRPNATKYVSECLKQYDSLFVNSPDITSFTKKMFKNKFNKSDTVDIIQKIEIITEDYNINSLQVEPKTPSILKHNESKKEHSMKNCNNLAQIHSAFQIQGDISDKDLENINSVELQKLRAKFLKQKSDYEYQRFLQHSYEDE